jgi:hypothetical protein
MHSVYLCDAALVAHFHAACKDCKWLSKASISKRRADCAPPLIADVRPH